MQLFIKISKQLWRLLVIAAERFSAFLEKKLEEKKP